VLDLIEQKVAGQEIVAAPAQPARAQIIDLMEALKASLAAKQAAVPAAPPERRRPAQAKGQPPAARRAGAKAK